MILISQKDRPSMPSSNPSTNEGDLIRRWMPIAGLVLLDTYLQNPEDFAGLEQWLADPANRQAPSRNVESVADAREGQPHRQRTLRLAALILTQLEHRILKRCSAPDTCADARGL